LITPVNGHAPDDMATIDHLYSKLDEHRQDINHGIIRKSRKGNTVVVRRVLACYACNQERGRLECKSTKLKEQREASVQGLLDRQLKRDVNVKSNHSVLHECDYRERQYRLKELQRRIDEGGISGLISVMGLPLKGGVGSDISFL
jgi:hypothetical protein